MQESTTNNLARVMEQAADEATKAEKAINEHDGGRATKLLLRTLALTAEAIETLAEFDGPLNAITNIAPNVMVYANALELVSKGDFEGALQETRGKSAGGELTKSERRVWLSAYGSAFSYAVLSNEAGAKRDRMVADAEHVADLAVERMRSRAVRR